jgi:tRNA nucleotidyltransferase (CCA-adding enzyme)
MISSKIMKQIISKIAKTTIPSNIIQKSKKEIADKVYKLVEKEIQKYSEVVELEFGGSYAKDTWLSKNADIDIFIKFKKSTSEEKLENISDILNIPMLKLKLKTQKLTSYHAMMSKVVNGKVLQIDHHFIQNL